MHVVMVADLSSGTLVWAAHRVLDTPDISEKAAMTEVRAVQVDIRLDPASKALGFNWLKVHPFQAVGFKFQPPAPLHGGDRAAVGERRHLGKGGPSSTGC